MSDPIVTLVEKRTANADYFKVFAKPEVMSFQTILNKLEYESKTIAAEFLILLNTIELNIVTVESLTAGKIASTFADIPSYSQCIYGGFVVYDSDAKREFVNVTVKSVYNQKCAKQMAEGALNKSRAMCALAVTGQAGGYDDTDETYLGYVDVAFSVRNINTDNQIIFETHTKRIKFCEDKFINFSCEEYKKRLKVFHTEQSCKELSPPPAYPPLTDDLYQIRQIIRTACVRDAIMFAYKCLIDNKYDKAFSTNLTNKIFNKLDRDIKLKYCGEPSKFIKKYIIDNSDLSLTNDEIKQKKWPHKFGNKGNNSNTEYNEYCDQKDFTEQNTESRSSNNLNGGYNYRKKYKKTKKMLKIANNQ